MRFEQGAEIARSRAHGRCEVCGHRGSQTHHRRARGMGGRSRAGLVVNRPSNLIRVCGGCHTWIEGNPREADQLGLLHPDGSDSPAWLNTIYGQGWWVLDDEGNYGWCHDREPPPAGSTPQDCVASGATNGRDARTLGGDRPGEQPAASAPRSTT